MDPMQSPPLSVVSSVASSEYLPGTPLSHRLVEREGTPTPAMRNNNQSVKWCFTLNNYTEGELFALRQLGWDAAVKYLVFGREVGESGTPHLQGFIYFHNRKRFHSVNTLLPRRCRICLADGTAWEAAKYCWKDDDFEEFGVRPVESYTKKGGQNTRELYAIAIEFAKKSQWENIFPDLFVRHYATWHRIARDFMVTPDPMETCAGLWIYGDTGTGKSHAVITQHPGRYIKPLNKWWDGYQGQDVVHLDELDPTHAPWITNYLKKWGDKWPFDAEIKGGALQIRPKLVVVTSNYKIDDMGFPEGCLAAIKRRFREVEKFRDQNIIVQ